MLCKYLKYNKLNSKIHCQIRHKTRYENYGVTSTDNPLKTQDKAKNAFQTKKNSIAGT